MHSLHISEETNFQPQPLPPLRRKVGMGGAKHLRLTTLLIAIVFHLFAIKPTAAQYACTGDCNGNHQVTIGELLLGANMLLGNTPVSACRQFDRRPDGVIVIAELIAGVGNTLEGCPRQQLAFAVLTDFFTGAFGTVSLGEPRIVVPANPQRQINSDAIVRVFGKLVYVVNRLFADNIQVLDPANDFATRLQCSTGNGSNPHEIVVLDENKAYVTLYNRTELLIVNPSAAPDCGDFILGSIDLSEFADADGIPEMDKMTIVDGRLYVSLQHLDRNTTLFSPAEPGALAVIDINTDEPLGVIPLTGEQPFGATKGLPVKDGAILVAQVGEFGVIDGGIERVDVDSGEAQGFFVTEEDLGGDITDFVVVSDQLAYAIVSPPNFTANLVTFNPTTGSPIATVLTGDGFTFADIELNDRGELYLGDRKLTAPGLRVFRASDGVELTKEPLDLILPPLEIVFVK